MSKDIPIVCFCVIFYQGKILLLKRSPHFQAHPNTWWFPGGHLEKGETLEQGLIREVFEETDIILHPSKLQLVLQDVSTNGKPLFLFTAKANDDFVALKDGEHTEYAWVEPCDLLQYNRTSIFSHYIKEAHMFQSSQYGLTSLSAPGAIYSEAVVSSSNGPVIKRGVVSDRSKVNPYHAPIIYKKNGSDCGCKGYGNVDCGCPKKSNPYGMLYVPAREKAIIYGNPVAFFTEANTTMKVVYGLLGLGVLYGAYAVVSKNMG